MSKSEKEATMQYAIATHLGEKNIVIPKLALQEHRVESLNMEMGRLLDMNIHLKGFVMKQI